MVDIDAAIGYVVARGDSVDRAHLSFLRTGAPPAEEIFEHVEMGQMPTGGWPAQWGGDVASIDATCFRLAELDGLAGVAGLGRTSAMRALDWLANRQRLDGFWEEDPALRDSAPPWAMPGDLEARFYLTVNAAFWLAVAAVDAGPSDVYAGPLAQAARAILDSLDDHGSWPGFLVSGWLAGAARSYTSPTACTKSWDSPIG